MDLLTFMFSFEGRFNRARYWGAVGLLFVGLIIGILAVALLSSILTVLGYGIGGIIYIVVMISSFAISTKRFHDRNKSGWWSTIQFLPILLSAMSALVTTSSALIVVSSICSTGIAIWFFIELGCLRGTVGSNRFGPDPLKPVSNLDASLSQAQAERSVS